MPQTMQIWPWKDNNTNSFYKELFAKLCRSCFHNIEHISTYHKRKYVYLIFAPDWDELQGFAQSSLFLNFSTKLALHTPKPGRFCQPEQLWCWRPGPRSLPSGP